MPSVGDDLYARAFRFSDDLLVEEERTFGRIEQRFIDVIPAAREIQDRAYARGLTAARSLEYDVRAIGRLARAALDASAADHRALLARGVTLALDSIGDELLLLEQEMPRRYAGLTAEAVAAIDDDAADEIAADSLAAYRQQAPSLVTTLTQDLRTEWRAAHVFTETVEQVDRRLFSTTQVPLPGHVGNGLWWKPYQASKAFTREGTIYAVNGVRTAVMREFNRLGEQRA